MPGNASETTEGSTASKVDVVVNNKENEIQQASSDSKRRATDVDTATSKTDSTTAESLSSPQKRLKTTSVEAASSPAATAATPANKTNNETSSTPLDLAVTLGFKAGDRVEVQWEVGAENSTDDNNSTSNTPKVTWWPATLLEFDGRTTDSVAIRTLHYDPLPEMGFPESSKEDVVFLGDELLVSPDSQVELHYRKVGQDGDADDQKIYWYKEGDMADQLNAILMGALSKNQAAWRNLTPAQQATIAEQIKQKKEKLLTVLREQKEVITSASIKDILQKAFQS